MTLLVTPKAQSDESYSGYILRLANSNGFSGIQRFACTLQIGKKVLDVALVAPEALSNALQVPASSLPPQPSMSEGGRYRQRAGYRATLEQSGWPVATGWCPHCLKAKAYWRAHWDWPAMPACLEHGIRLVRCCPRCRGAVGIERRQLLSCACGLDLRACFGQQASKEEQQFSESLVLKSSELTQQLANACIETQRMYMRWLTCHLHLVGSPAAKLNATRDGSLLKAMAQSEIGRKFFAMPEETVFELLREIMAQARLGRLISTSGSGYAIPPFVRQSTQALREQAKGRVRNNEGTDSVDLIVRIRERGYASAIDLVRLFGGSERLWSSFLSSGKIRRVTRFQWSGRPTWRVPSEAVDELTIMFRQTLSRDEVAARLRIAPMQVVGLATLGLIKRLFVGYGTLQNRSLLSRFRIAEIDELMELLDALAFPMHRVPASREVVPLAAALTERSSSKQYRAWARAVALVLGGEVPVYQISPLREKGMMAFAIAIKDAPMRQCRLVREAYEC